MEFFIRGSGNVNLDIFIIKSQFANLVMDLSSNLVDNSNLGRSNENCSYIYIYIYIPPVDD